MYSFLKFRKQSVFLKNKCSSFLELISRAQEGLVLGALLFNIFLNDLLFLFIKMLCHNYAGGNTLSAEQSQTTINWLKENSIIVNP